MQADRSESSRDIIVPFHGATQRLLEAPDPILLASAFCFMSFPAASTWRGTICLDVCVHVCVRCWFQVLALTQTSVVFPAELLNLRPSQEEVCDMLVLIFPHYNVHRPRWKISKLWIPLFEDLWNPLLESLLYMFWQPGESLTYSVKPHTLKTATVSFPRAHTDRQANGFHGDIVGALQAAGWRNFFHFLTNFLYRILNLNKGLYNVVL